MVTFILYAAVWLIVGFVGSCLMYGDIQAAFPRLAKQDRIKDSVLHLFFVPFGLFSVITWVTTYEGKPTFKLLFT